MCDLDSRISISLAVSVPAVFVIGGGIVSVCLSLLVFKHNKNNRGVKEENSQQLQQNKNSSTKGAVLLLTDIIIQCGKINCHCT